MDEIIRNKANIAIDRDLHTGHLSTCSLLLNGDNHLQGNLTTYKQVNSDINLEMLNNFANPVLVIGIDKIILFINRALENLTKFSVAEVIGLKPPYPWWPKGTARSYSARFVWAIRHGGDQYHRLFRDKNGKDFWVAIHLTSFVYNGNLSCYIVNWVNVTSQEEKNQKVTRELYLNEKKLRHKLQTEINRRGKYFKLLVHELKTPMTATLYSSELLCEHLINETHTKLARNIYRAISNLNNRIDELMDLAKGEMGIIELHIATVNIREMLLQITDDFDSIILQQGKMLKLDLPTYIPSIRCDPIRVRQILQNLLNNAVKFTSDGDEITIRVKIMKDNLIIEVQDTGCGISKYEQRLVFTPYCNVKRNKESFSGLGLGLSLCKILVELHGGHISVQSEVGKGANFICSFPLVIGENRQGKGLPTANNENINN
jgi:PAS domain S-box-containing protein